MAKKQTAVIRAFTDAEKNQYKELTTKINEAQGKADGLARTIAGSLHQIKIKGLYELEGYKNIYEYAETVHGIARGTTSDAINVFARFQNPDNKSEIKAEYMQYPFRALIMMKSLTDEQIDFLGIMPTMKSAEIKQRIQDFRKVEHLLPEGKDAKWDYAQVVALCEAQEKLEDKQAEENSNYDPNDECLEDGSNTTSEQEKSSVIPESTVSYVEKAKNIMGQEAFEQFSEAEQGDLENACKDYVDEFVEFPKRTVKIDPETINDPKQWKSFCSMLKDTLAKVIENEFDLIITA